MLSENLKYYRQQAKMSQKALAAQLFVSQQAVAKWEKDTSTPNPETLTKIADVFKISVDDLLSENRKEPVPENGDGLTDLEADILERMSRLTPEDRVRVDAYIQGLLAAREDETAL